MAQVVKKFIQNNAVDENKIRLSNNANLKARNAANSADVSILKVNASDKIEFASVPQATSDASAGNDLVRYSQIQSLIDGLKPKQAVRVASTTSGTLATDFENGDIVDGVTLATNDRILLKNQSSPSENGIYVVQASGAPVRASDFNAPSEIPGSYTVAQEGTIGQGVLYVCLSSPATIGVDPIQFAVRSITALSGGDMITVSGGEISVDLASVSGLESSNPGNASGELRIKLEASNPTLQIDGSNQLGAKLDAAGAIKTGSGGLAISLEASNPSLQISSNELGLKMDSAGALEKIAGGVSVRTDDITVKINGSNNLESLKHYEQKITLNNGQINSQHIDLAFAAYGVDANNNSIQLSVIGGPIQEKDVDYTISLTGGGGGVTRINFAGDLATGGAAALVQGDKLVISYSYLT
jgi:hypothetical protein